MSRTGVMQNKVPSSLFQCLSPPPESIHHSIPQWGVGNGLTFLRSTNQSDSRCFSLGTFMACHKAGLWGITAPSNPAKWAIFPLSGAAVRWAWAVNSRVNLWPWLLGQPSAVTSQLGPGGRRPAAKVKQPRCNDEIAFSSKVGSPFCPYLSVVCSSENSLSLCPPKRISHYRVIQQQNGFT